MCECKTNIQNLLKDKFDAEKVELMCYGLAISDTVKIKGYAVAEILKQNKTKVLKKSKINMYFSFCPFCGEKY